MIPSAGDGRQRCGAETDIVEVLGSLECSLCMMYGAGEVTDEAKLPAQPPVNPRFQRRIPGAFNQRLPQERDGALVMREISSEVEYLGTPSSRRSATEQLGDEFVGAAAIGLGNVGVGERERPPMDGVDIVGRRQPHGLLGSSMAATSALLGGRRVARLLERGGDLEVWLIRRPREVAGPSSGSSTRPESSRWTSCRRIDDNRR